MRILRSIMYKLIYKRRISGKYSVCWLYDGWYMIVVVAVREL